MRPPTGSLGNVRKKDPAARGDRVFGHRQGMPFSRQCFKEIQPNEAGNKRSVNERDFGSIDLKVHRRKVRAIDSATGALSLGNEGHDFLDVLLAADHQRRAIVHPLGFDIQNTVRPVDRQAAGLFGDHRQRIGLVH